MKRKIALIMCLVVMVSVMKMPMITYASVNEIINHFIETESIGLADEATLLQEKELFTDVRSDKQALNEGLYEVDNKVLDAENVEMLFPEEQIEQFTQFSNEIRVNAETVGLEPEVNSQQAYTNFVENAFVSSISSVETKSIVPETRATYYAGCPSLPTYTYITGRSLYDSESLDDGYVVYTYKLVDDEYSEYISYVIDYFGWQLYDYVTDNVNLTISSYLVKDNTMVAVAADFYYGYVTVLFKTSSATVNPTSISLDISKRTMIVGNQYTLEATIYPSNATNQSVTWSTSNSSVASVSSSGVVTAKAAGSATITAKTSNGKTATCSITVKKLVLDYYPNTKIPTFTCITGINLYDSMEDDGTMMYFYDLDIESHTDYEAYLVNKDGWSILDEETASDYSYFSALYGKGNVTMLVMANFEKGLTGIAFATPVSTVPVTGVALNKTSANMTVGDTMTLTATISPSTATNKNVTWSSSNTSVATVSTSGVVTAKAAGTTTITVKTADGNKTATCNITVKETVISVTGVSLNKTSATMDIGETLTLTAAVAPSNATDKSVTWSSSNTSVATVSSSGVVTAKAAGTAVITVTTADGSKKATCNITVKEAVISVTGVSLNKTSATMDIGDTVTLTATVAPSNATDKSVTWSSSNTSVATVSSSGVVTAKAVGTTTITAKTLDGNKSATCTVTVKTDEILVTQVTLNKKETTLFVGNTETLFATITPADATNMNVVWSSSDNSVATVSSNGVVTAKEVGTTTITVTTVDGNKTATCDVTVKTNLPLISVESVYAQKGKSVKVTVELMNNPGIALIGFDVYYNKDVMTLESAELGDVFTGELECNIDAVPFVFNTYSGSNNKTNDGTLVTLEFGIKEDCPAGEYDIEIDNIECLNLDELTVNLNWEDGTITVRDCIPGDVTGDGSVTRSDLLRLAKHFSGFTVEIDEAAADVTGDGQVTRSDLLRLAKHFSGFNVVLGK